MTARSGLAPRWPFASVVAAVALAALATLGLAASRAGAQGAAPPTLVAPRVLATALPVTLSGAGAAAGGRVTIERRLSGRWLAVGSARADRGGHFRLRVRPRPLARRYRFRALVPGGAPSTSVLVRSRDVILDAVGDVNLGNGVGAVIRARGARFPWSGVARELRSADLAFANLECAVSRRGRPVPKEFNFRGSPGALRVAARYAGLDVLNLANNHTGDFGRAALLDTIHFVRRFGMTAVGAGRDLGSARRPRVVRRLGLRIAFVGFSDILPASFAAGPRRPGTVFASPRRIAVDVRRAARRADVVVATFHWGVEGAGRPNARQRAFARIALRAGADAVIGGHPHVLEPIVRRGRRVVAYSLGNFVFAATSPATTRTGILRLRLSARGVERVRLLRARIRGVRPVLVSR